jgi:CheY-like chemotaxis protein
MNAAPPLNRISEEQTPTASARDQFYGGAYAGLTALIVDDDRRNAFALTALLKRGRMNVLVADSGQKALDTLQRTADIGIVLMDIMMPVMDGYQTMRAIRERPECAKLKMIAVTGKAVAGERERCVAAGANDYMLKPIDTAALLKAICHWLPRAGAPASPR